MTIQEPKQAIVDKVANVDEGLWRRKYENFNKRSYKNALTNVTACHLPDVIKKGNLLIHVK